MSKPSSGFWKKTPMGPSRVMRVRARGITTLAVTPYLSITFAVLIVRETMPALAAA